MRQRHNVENNVKKFYKMIKAGTVVFDNPIQRDDNQWSLSQKSKLIRSILIDYAIPPVYSVGVQNATGETVYSILDGKQRLTTLAEFLDNKFKLLNIDKIEVEGHSYTVKNKRFEQLEEELRDIIEDYSINMVYYSHLSDDEIAEMFDLLNNGTPLSRQQKATASMGLEGAKRMNELKKHPFMIINVAISKTHALKSTDMEILTQAMMLVDPNYEIDSYSGKNMDNYSALLKEKDYMFDLMKDILDYTHDALDFYSDALVLKKTITPMILYIGNIAMKENLDKDLFFEWIRDFKLSIENRGSINIDFRQYMGTGSFSHNKVRGRVHTALYHYEKFVKSRKAISDKND